ncbi:phospholipase A1-like [Phymastichus coffea]|uniref:phospholipase A1-like n=1 Tax=Phymastichus coffea TaxID=108790 RepID=UPI00273B7A30|nr:phospholipase A1-like [Phymastichus coffea]
MKFIIILLCLASYSSVKCYDREESEVFEDAETGSECRHCESDDKFEDAYDSNQFFTKLEKINDTEIMSKQKISLNCFGLGRKLANWMDSFLRNESNGTEAMKVLFYSRTRSRPERKLIQCGQTFSIEETDFDITKRTVFIVHGFFADADEQWVIDMEQALLSWGDLNVFVVDWSDGASTWNYLKAAVNTKTVGDQIATFINQIIDDVIENVEASEWGPLHLIGHSLGAHICGYTSHELKLRGNQWPVYRITGLDPAQPCFRYSDLSLRLDKSDAYFVDVIHTNGRILRKMGLGLPYPLGHVDFYPNGGRVQPGCILAESSFWNFLPAVIKEIKKTVCSHGRSQIYFIESIYIAVENNCTFWAREWDMSFVGLQNLSLRECNVDKMHHECIEMGINAEKYHHNGTFFTVTTSSSPFCNVSKYAIDEVVENIERKITTTDDYIHQIS